MRIKKISVKNKLHHQNSNITKTQTACQYYTLHNLILLLYYIYKHETYIIHHTFAAVFRIQKLDDNIIAQHAICPVNRISVIIIKCMLKRLKVKEIFCLL